MIVQKVALEDTGQFTPIFLDYIHQTPDLAQTYTAFPTIAAFKAQIQQKELSESGRNILAEVLTEQYQHLERAPHAQIDALKSPKTFTVTTGHQLNIFSGPLYFIYKIVSTINLAEQLKKNYPDFHFVPIYWMATEDHDFEEISHFTLFGKKYIWETTQKGAVGRMNTEGLEKLWEEIQEMPEFFKRAYQAGDTLADATRYYVHHLFGEKGLLVIDADSPALKKQFANYITDDIFHGNANALVEKQNATLAEMGYKSQVFPRKINFFYLKEALRERIEQREDGSFQVLNTAITFSKEEMQSEIAQYPERFSPNVVMRPLYQEVILPNLAYLGGPAEVSYWLQLKPVFEHYNIPFPILMPRNFALVVNKGNYKKMQKLVVSTDVFFQDEHKLKTWFVEKNAENIFELSHETVAFKKVYKEITTKAEEIDGSLVGFVAAEMQKGLKSLQNIEKRLRKAEEQKHETALKQLLSVKERLFPHGVPQERIENMLNFYLNDRQFIDTLFDNFDPFDFRMNIFIYND